MTLSLTCSIPTWHYLSPVQYQHDTISHLFNINMTLSLTCSIPTWHYLSPVQYQHDTISHLFNISMTLSLTCSIPAWHYLSPVQYQHDTISHLFNTNMTLSLTCSIPTWHYLSPVPQWWSWSRWRVRRRWRWATLHTLTCGQNRQMLTLVCCHLICTCSVTPTVTPCIQHHLNMLLHKLVWRKPTTTDPMDRNAHARQCWLPTPATSIPVVVSKRQEHYHQVVRNNSLKRSFAVRTQCDVNPQQLTHPMDRYARARQCWPTLPSSNQHLMCNNDNSTYDQFQYNCPIRSFTNQRDLISQQPIQRAWKHESKMGSG